MGRGGKKEGKEGRGEKGKGVGQMVNLKKWEMK
jgi:hypothetical protein